MDKTKTKATGLGKVIGYVLGMTILIWVIWLLFKGIIAIINLF